MPLAPTSTSTTALRILFLGATGYIGGSVLDRLIAHPDQKSWDIISYSRNAEKAEVLLSRFGIKSIIGTLDENQKIEDAAAMADIVIHTADSSDHIGSVQAILRGLRQKHKQSGKVPIYIHTSGTGVLADDAKGLHGDHIIYDDTDVEQLKSIPSSAVHREVDLAVLAADEEGYARTYIVVPSVIYGLAAGPLFDAKIANPHSVMVPALITSSIDRGRAGYVGEGKNFWPHVHIQDTADLYLVLFNNLLTNPEKVGHGWEGFYFGENGTFGYKELANKIGDALVEVGRASDSSPKPYTKEELGRYFGGTEYLGSNSFCTATRARALGWNPKYTTEDFFASILPEVEEIIASGRLGMSGKFATLLAQLDQEKALK